MGKGYLQSLSCKTLLVPPCIEYLYSIMHYALWMESLARLWKSESCGVPSQDLQHLF